MHGSMSTVGFRFSTNTAKGIGDITQAGPVEKLLKNTKDAYLIAKNVSWQSNNVINHSPNKGPGQVYIDVLEFIGFLGIILI